MRKLIFLALALSLFISAQAQDNVLKYKIDLNKVVDDQLTVELTVPQMKEDKVSFHLPKMVPGTYSIYDFGRFVTDINVFDKDGNGSLT